MSDLQVELNRLAGIRNASPNLFTSDGASYEGSLGPWVAESNCIVTRALSGTLRLPGLLGNYVSTPNAADIQITGDIDLRAKVAMDSWTPATDMYLISKVITTTGGYGFRVLTTGVLRFLWADGVALNQADSTVSTGLAAGAVKWVRATLTVNNGAVGRDIKFYTSDDGAAWTQLGATVTQAVVTVIGTDASVLALGAISGDGSSLRMQGYIYRAEVYNGIGGTLVAWFDATLVPFQTTQTPTTVAQSGRTWTLNGSLWSWVPPAANGQWVMAVQATATGTNWVARISAASGAIHAITGRSYSQSAQLMAGYGSTRAAGCQINWSQDSSGVPGAYISSSLSGGPNLSTSVWTQHTGSAAAPALAAWATPGIHGASSNWVIGETTYVDTNMFSEGAGSAFAWYPPTDSFGMLDAQGAANLWAGINPPNLFDLQGALNYKAGISPPNLLDLNGVCQYLGIAGAPAQSALVGLANVVRLPGLTGNYISAPDSAAISITGDIDIRAKIAPDSWNSGLSQTVVGKWDSSSGAQRSYLLRLDTVNSLLNFFISTTGSDTIQTNSSVHSLVNGAATWVRVTRVQSSGLVSFYTSTDGVNWTALGTGTASAGNAIFDGPAALTVGSQNAGSANSLQGYIYYAEVRNGIAGTVVASFDASLVAPRGLTSPSTITQGSTTWTINGSAWYWDVSTSASKTPIALQLDAQYVQFDGTSGNYASTPDSAALSIVGDIDIRVKVALDDWTPTVAANNLLAKWTTSQDSYRLGVGAGAGFPFMGVSLDGTTQITAAATAPPVVADGGILWLRCTRASASGTVTFYTSADGIAWTQLGNTVATTAGAIFDSTSAVEIGSRDTGQGNLAGKVYYAEVRNGIGGTIAARFKATTTRNTAIRTPNTFTDEGSGTPVWTINGSAWQWSPTPSPFITTPDSAALSITGDIDLRAKVTLTDWVASGFQYLFHKRSTGGYTFRLQGDSPPSFLWHDGTTTRSVTASVVPPFSSGATGWMRVTLDVDNGSGGHAVNFYTSTDGVIWSQLGTADLSAGAFTTSIGDSTDVLEIGSGFTAGARINGGKIHYAEVRNGIAGTVVGVFNPNVMRRTNPMTATTLASPTGETYTLTGSGWRWV